MTQHKGRYNLFGLDLAELGRFYVEGWRDAMAWPVMRLFRGRDPVRVTAPDGTQSVRFGRSAEPVTFKGKVERQACELPEDLLLRRTLVMPRMSEKDLAQAMTLDARSASPFPEQDLVWGYAVRDAVDGERVRIESVMASRAAVMRHLSGLGLVASAVEVWAGGAKPLVIRGFGEGERKGRGGLLQRVGITALFVVALLLLIAIALTPMLQLRLRALDAIEHDKALAKVASQQVNLRSDLIRFNGALEAANTHVEAYANPLVVLDELSRILPDDVLVNTLEFKGNSVRLTGQANNAARLIDLLGAEPKYQEVKSLGATTRVQGSSKEYFAIEFKVVRAEKKS